MLQFKTLSLPLPVRRPHPKKRTVRSTAVKAWSSPIETRVALITALATQAAAVSQRSLIDASKTAAQLVLPPDARSLEEALMSVPDLESVDYKVIAREDEYEIREVQPYFVAETTMPGNTGFDFVGSSQSFNALAAYLFGKNEKKEEMEMTSPVYIRKAEAAGVKMEMTTPVVTKKIEEEKWKMAFIMPAKYGGNLPLPKDSSVRITQIPSRIVAVVAFSGFITDGDVRRRELKLRSALQNDASFKVKEGAFVEVAQFNPPFTLPFRRRNEIALEVERTD